MKPKQSPSLTTVILFGATALLWIVSAILQIVFGIESEDIIFFVIDVLCAVSSTTVFAVNLWRYQKRKASTVSGSTMFLKFSSPKERRKAGGSCFVELQYCTLPAGTPDQALVAVEAIRHWDLTSLYVHGDDNRFFAAYKDIFTDGLYNNLRKGVVDLWGINYFDPAQTARILALLEERRPCDWEVLHDWLKQSPYSNGFYILGV